MSFCATHFMSFLKSRGYMNDNARIISINGIIRNTRTLHRKYCSSDIRYPRGTVPFPKRAHRPLAAISASPRSIHPFRGNAPPSARAPRAAVPSLFAFLMSLSLSAFIRPSMRSIQLALYRQAAPGRPRLSIHRSGFSVRSATPLSALANQAPCSVSPNASYASDNPSANSLLSSMQIQQIR